MISLESCAVLGSVVYLVPLLNIFVQNFHSCLNNKLMDLQESAAGTCNYISLVGSFSTTVELLLVS